MARKKKTTAVKKKELSKELLDAVAELRSRLLKVNFQEMPHTDDVMFEWYIHITVNTILSLIVDTDTNESFLIFTNVDEEGNPQDSVIIQIYDDNAIFDVGWRKYITVVVCTLAKMFSSIFYYDDMSDEFIDDVINDIERLPYKN